MEIGEQRKKWLGIRLIIGNNIGNNSNFKKSSFPTQRLEL